MLEIPAVQDLGGVLLLDTRHLGNQGTVGSYLLPGEGGRFALIETGPGSTLPTLLLGIRRAGFDPADLDSILVTHIHLDHAGAAGDLAKESGATVYVHDLGAAHLADPSRLMASATRIYGEDMERLWGDMIPISETQVRLLSGGERLRVLGRDIRVFYTPGHASHHVAYLLEDDAMFTGDAANVRLAGSSVIRPALPPPEIDLETWEKSIETMLEAQPKRLMLTHFGEVTDAEGHLRALPERNRRWAEAILAGMRLGEADDALTKRIASLGDAELAADGASSLVAARHQATSNYRMTVLGVARYWRKHHPELVAVPRDER